MRRPAPSAAHKKCMGHQTETAYVNLATASTADRAIRDAVSDWNANERNRYEDARDGHSDKHPMMTPAAAERSMGEAGFEVRDGKSVAIPVCAADDAVEKVTKRKLTVTATDLSSYRRGNTWEFSERIRKEFGPTVIGSKVIVLPKARKAVATATDGKASTQYVVSQPGGRGSGTFHATQSAARAYAIRVLNENPTISDLEVTAVIVRDTGNLALVTITRLEAEVNEITVEVTTSEPKTGAKQAGWFVGFDYHS
jgi:hypothetical protein